MAHRFRKNLAPPGWHTLTPRIFVHGMTDCIAFLRKVFGARGRYQSDRPTQLTIGDSILMVNEVGARPATGAFLYVYVRDVDLIHRKAVRAGAKSVEAPTQMPYGDRRCMFEDRWGNVWQVATRIKRTTRRSRPRA